MGNLKIERIIRENTDLNKQIEDQDIIDIINDINTVAIEIRGTKNAGLTAGLSLKILDDITIIVGDDGLTKTTYHYLPYIQEVLENYLNSMNEPKGVY